MNKKFGEMKSARLVWESLWTEVARFTNPARENMFDANLKAYQPCKDMFDTTALSSVQLFVEGIYGHLLSPAIDWFKLTLHGYEDVVEVSKWLEEVEGLLYAAFRRSNFYSEVLTVLNDGASVGTAIMYMEEDLAEGSIMFKAINPGMAWIAENKHGRVNTVYRELNPTETVAKEMFGENAEAGKYYHCVEPKDETWKSEWFDGSCDEPIKTAEFNYFPYAVWRYSKLNHEAYGRSVSMNALPTIKLLNELKKAMLKAAQLAVQPPINAPAGMDVDLAPNGINWYDDPSQMIQPTNIGVNYNVGLDKESDLKQGIKDFYMTDMFLMISQSERAMTATEVMAKQGEKAAVLGSMVGRITSELLDPIVNTVFHLEYQAGRLPEPPPSIQEESIDIEYMGPLAQAQKRLFTSRGAEQSMASVAPLMQINPEIVDNFDLDSLARNLARSTGMPAEVMVEEAVVADLRQRRDQQAAQQQSMQMALEHKDIIGQVAQAAPEGG